MKNLALYVGMVAAIAFSSTSAVAQPSASVAVTTGKVIYDSEGRRIGPVYRVTSEGNAQVILSGKLVIIPASTVSDANGKITTSISRADLGRAR